MVIYKSDIESSSSRKTKNSSGPDWEILYNSLRKGQYPDAMVENYSREQLKGIISPVMIKIAEKELPLKGGDREYLTTRSPPLVPLRQKSNTMPHPRKYSRNRDYRIFNDRDFFEKPPPPPVSGNGNFYQAPQNENMAESADELLSSDWPERPNNPQHKCYMSDQEFAASNCRRRSKYSRYNDESYNHFPDQNHYGKEDYPLPRLKQRYQLLQPETKGNYYNFRPNNFYENAAAQRRRWGEEEDMSKKSSKFPENYSPRPTRATGPVNGFAPIPVPPTDLDETYVSSNTENGGGGHGHLFHRPPKSSYLADDISSSSIDLWSSKLPDFTSPNHYYAPRISTPTSSSWVYLEPKSHRQNIITNGDSYQTNNPGGDNANGWRNGPTKTHITAYTNDHYPATDNSRLTLEREPNDCNKFKGGVKRFPDHNNNNNHYYLNSHPRLREMDEKLCDLRNDHFEFECNKKSPPPPHHHRNYLPINYPNNNNNYGKGKNGHEISEIYSLTLTTTPLSSRYQPVLLRTGGGGNWISPEQQHHQVNFVEDAELESIFDDFEREIPVLWNRKERGVGERVLTNTTTTTRNDTTRGMTNQRSRETENTNGGSPRLLLSSAAPANNTKPNDKSLLSRPYRNGTNENYYDNQAALETAVVVPNQTYRQNHHHHGYRHNSILNDEGNDDYFHETATTTAEGGGGGGGVVPRFKNLVNRKRIIHPKLEGKKLCNLEKNFQNGVDSRYFNKVTKPNGDDSNYNGSTPYEQEFSSTNTKKRFRFPTNLVDLWSPLNETDEGTRSFCPTVNSKLSSNLKPSHYYDKLGMPLRNLETDDNLHHDSNVVKFTDLSLFEKSELPHLHIPVTTITTTTATSCKSPSIINPRISLRSGAQTTKEAFGMKLSHNLIAQAISKLKKISHPAPVSKTTSCTTTTTATNSSTSVITTPPVNLPSMNLTSKMGPNSTNRTISTTLPDNSHLLAELRSKLHSRKQTSASIDSIPSNSLTSTITISSPPQPKLLYTTPPSNNNNNVINKTTSLSPFLPITKLQINDTEEKDHQNLYTNNYELANIPVNTSLTLTSLSDAICNTFLSKNKHQVTVTGAAKRTKPIIKSEKESQETFPVTIVTSTTPNIINVSKINLNSLSHLPSDLSDFSEFLASLNAPTHITAYNNNTVIRESNKDATSIISPASSSLVETRTNQIAVPYHHEEVKESKRNDLKARLTICKLPNVNFNHDDDDEIIKAHRDDILPQNCIEQAIGKSAEERDVGHTDFTMSDKYTMTSSLIISTPTMENGTQTSQILNFDDPGIDQSALEQDNISCCKPKKLVDVGTGGNYSVLEPFCLLCDDNFIEEERSNSHLHEGETTKPKKPHLFDVATLNDEGANVGDICATPRRTTVAANITISRASSFSVSDLSPGAFSPPLRLFQTYESRTHPADYQRKRRFYSPPASVPSKLRPEPHYPEEAAFDDFDQSGKAVVSCLSGRRRPSELLLDESSFVQTYGLCRQAGKLNLCDPCEALIRATAKTFADNRRNSCYLKYSPKKLSPPLTKTTTLYNSDCVQTHFLNSCPKNLDAALTTTTSTSTPSSSSFLTNDEDTSTAVPTTPSPANHLPPAFVQNDFLSNQWNRVATTTPVNHPPPPPSPTFVQEDLPNHRNRVATTPANHLPPHDVIQEDLTTHRNRRVVNLDNNNNDKNNLNNNNSNLINSSSVLFDGQEEGDEYTVPSPLGGKSRPFSPCDLISMMMKNTLPPPLNSLTTMFDNKQLPSSQEISPPPPVTSTIQSFHQSRNNETCNNGDIDTKSSSRIESFLSKDKIDEIITKLSDRRASFRSKRSKTASSPITKLGGRPTLPPSSPLSPPSVDDDDEIIRQNLPPLRSKTNPNIIVLPPTILNSALVPEISCDDSIVAVSTASTTTLLTSTTEPPVLIIPTLNNRHGLLDPTMFGKFRYSLQNYRRKMARENRAALFSNSSPTASNTTTAHHEGDKIKPRSGMLLTHSSPVNTIFKSNDDETVGDQEAPPFFYPVTRKRNVTRTQLPVVTSRPYEKQRKQTQEIEIHFNPLCGLENNEGDGESLSSPLINNNINGMMMIKKESMAATKAPPPFPAQTNTMIRVRNIENGQFLDKGDLSLHSDSNNCRMRIPNQEESAFDVESGDEDVAEEGHYDVATNRIILTDHHNKSTRKKFSAGYSSNPSINNNERSIITTTSTALPAFTKGIGNTATVDENTLHQRQTNGNVLLKDKQLLPPTLHHQQQQRYNYSGPHKPHLLYYEPILEDPAEKFTFDTDFEKALNILNESITLDPKEFRHTENTLINMRKIVTREWFKLVINACNMTNSTTGNATTINKDCDSNLLREEESDVNVLRLEGAKLIEFHLDHVESNISHRCLRYLVNCKDEMGNTALHYSISFGNFDVVSTLIDSKECDYDSTNNAGYTPVMLTALAKMDKPFYFEIATRLFQLANVNVKAKQNGQTALMLAASHGRIKLCQALIEIGGGDVNIQDCDGSTALMCAAEHGYSDIAKMLLTHSDIDTTLMDNDGSNALAIAVKAGHKDIGILIYAHQNLINLDNNNSTSSFRNLEKYRLQPSVARNKKDCSIRSNNSIGRLSCSPPSSDNKLAPNCTLSSTIGIAKNDKKFNNIVITKISDTYV